MAFVCLFQVNFAWIVRRRRWQRLAFWFVELVLSIIWIVTSIYSAVSETGLGDGYPPAEAVEIALLALLVIGIGIGWLRGYLTGLPSFSKSKDR